MQRKIAIIGPKNIVSGFSLLGVEPYHASSGEEALDLLRKMRASAEAGNDDSFGVAIVIEELLGSVAEEDRAQLSKGTLPAVVLLPGLSGSQGYGSDRLKELTEKAIGSDIFGDK